LASEFVIDLRSVKKECDVQQLRWVLSKNPKVTVRGHALDQLYARCAAFSTVPMEDFLQTQEFWAGWIAHHAFCGSLLRYHRETEHRYRYDLIPKNRELGVIRVVARIDEPEAYIPTFMAPNHNRYHHSDKARKYVTEIIQHRLRPSSKPAPYEPCRVTGRIDLPSDFE
jgi:hypothetical protein